MDSDKERQGNFFEDFHLGQVMRHGTHRTMTEGDAAVYLSLTGARQAMYSSNTAAALLGYSRRPIDDLLVFNVAFGKTVPDISLNAVANLGYAEVRFVQPVFAGDTLRCESVILGLKENSNRKSGVVYVRSTCYDQDDHTVLTWVRWVMVRKRRPASRARENFIPELSSKVSLDQLVARPAVKSRDAVDEWCETTGSTRLWEHFSVGDRINHPSGMTIEDSDHMSATRLYQNNARVHFDALAMSGSPGGRRISYGGHVISVCHALAYDGLENVVSILAINAGTHVLPTVAGDTLYAFTNVLEKWKIPGRQDVAALRLRLVGIKNTAPAAILNHRDLSAAGAAYHPDVVLDLDYTVLMPRRLSG